MEIAVYRTSVAPQAEETAPRPKESDFTRRIEMHSSQLRIGRLLRADTLRSRRETNETEPPENGLRLNAWVALQAVIPPLDMFHSFRDYPRKLWRPAVDVGVRLRGLGLGQYEEKFRDNKIGADVLPRLTADDLKDVGIAAVGDRRRLLDAIAALAAAKPADAPRFAHKSVPPKNDQLVAERRPITVMFCDLVGSM